MPIKQPTAVLKQGEIYMGDNGRLMCLSCAGVSALYTGRDISGQHVMPMTERDDRDWRKTFGKSMKCDCGKTTFDKP